MRYVCGNKLTLETIQQEHKKNVEVMNKSVKKRYRKLSIVTIFFTTENLPSNIDMESLDNIIIISRDRFEEYYGNIILRIARSASKSFVNVNTLTFEELKCFEGIGDDLANIII